MELTQLEMFMHLSRYENMSVVAQIMNTSQPHISRMLASLEAELGVKLFNRAGRNIAINEQGRTFLRYVQSALDAVNAGRGAITSVRNEIMGEIRIGSYAFASILNPVIIDYAKEHPLVQFRLHSGSGGGGSANILLTSMLNDHYVSEAQYPVFRELFDEQYHLVFSAAHFPELTSRGSISLKDVIDYPLILMGPGSMYVNSDNFLRETLMHMTNQSPQIAFETGDYTQKMLLVLEGRGLSLLPDSCLESAGQIVPDLQILEFSDFSYKRTIAVARKPRALLSDAENDFWDFILVYYKKAPDSGS